MPKNAVHRLHKIENDIKTVISIFDVANKSENEKHIKQQQENPENNKINSAKNVDDLSVYNKIQENVNQDPNLFIEPFKKIGSYTCRSVQNNHPLPMKKYWANKKPGSAPSSSSTLTTISESDDLWQAQSGFVNNLQPTKEIDLQKTEEDESNSAEEYEENSQLACDIFLTPSKTIETANHVLATNNYQFLEEDKNTNLVNRSGSYFFIQHIDDQDEHYDEYQLKTECSIQELSSPGHQHKSISKMNTRKIKIKEAESEMEIPNKTSSSSFTKERNSKEISTEPSTTPLLPKAFVIMKSPSEPKNDISVVGQKIFRLDKQTPKSIDLKSTLKAYSESKSLKEKQNKIYSFNVKTEGNSLQKPQIKNGQSDKNDSTQKIPENNELKRKSSVKGNLKGKRDEKIGMEKAVSKTLEALESELGLHELFKIIEKSNEKLEKMKLSKVLALDIAKQLKDKYEVIQQSKEELLERLQKVEKDNERLNNEVKDAHQSTIKLQLKMEEFKNDSKTMLLEQDARNKDILNENSWLKSKVAELEKRHNGEMIEKERLMSEKSELRTKIDELNSFLRDRHSTVEKLEDKITELQEEIQKQKHHLKQKTDRLDDTNKELESIRKNSRDLEGQVKVLRQNIESFDEMHRNLVIRTEEYENEMKSQQEEIKKLREENAQIKADLENEKDSLLIKNKIIEDQQETIKNLREKSDELKTLIKKNQSLERVLNIEREEKLELQEALERLKWRKEELKKRIRTLEGDLLIAPQEVVRDLQKTQVVLHELENQVQIKQKEWELHLQSLIREKEQACSVAEELRKKVNQQFFRFATKKLMQTTNEFQKQSEAQKRLHRVLAENLAEKERYLREATEKVSHLPINQIMMDLNADVGKTGRMLESPREVVKDCKDILEIPPCCQQPISNCHIECQQRKRGNFLRIPKPRRLKTNQH